MRIQIFLLLFVGLLVLAGCPSGDDDDTAPANVEGDEAGECDDGVDNDQDGVTDCDDDGCENATACTGDDDTGDDDTADDDTGDDDTGDDDTGDDDTGDDDTASACEDAGQCEGDYVLEDAADRDYVAQFCDVVTGDLVVDDQDWLVSLVLPCLVSVDGALTIRENDHADLATVEMPALVTVGGDLDVDDDDSLVTFDMPSLTTVGGHLDIYRNISLATFDMSALTTVGGYLEIESNASLGGLGGLPSLASVGGYLSIRGNPCLSQLEAVAFAEPISVHSYTDVSLNGDDYPCP